MQRARAFHPHFVIIPWWTFFLGPLFAYLAWSLRRSGIDVVFFCHNVLDHEDARWKRVLTKLVLRQGRRFLVHTRVEEARLKRLFPGAHVAVHPHPIYDQFPKPKRQLPRRAALELLFFGFVRPYKGLDILIESMGLLRGQDVFLTVAGEFWQGEADTRKRIAELGIDNQIEIIARYISDEDTADLFGRADAVVVPYRTATGSGVIPIAYNYNKPVIATRVGGLSDVVREGETGWLIRPQSVEELAERIGSLIDNRPVQVKFHIEQLKRELSWERLSQCTLDHGVNSTL